MTDNEKRIVLPTDWGDFGERVLRAGITSAIAVALALHVTIEGFTLQQLETWARAVGSGFLMGALTAAKSLIFQGRGSNPSDGSAR